MLTKMSNRITKIDLFVNNGWELDIILFLFQVYIALDVSGVCMLGSSSTFSPNRSGPLIFAHFLKSLRQK